jgi:deoxyuridine 5'-triphosphate nucleotidohydrolase
LETDIKLYQLYIIEMSSNIEIIESPAAPAPEITATAVQTTTEDVLDVTECTVDTPTADEQGGIECQIDSAAKVLTVPMNENIVKELETLKIKYIKTEDDKLVIQGVNFIDYVGYTVLKQQIQNAPKIIGEPLVNFAFWKTRPDAQAPFKSRFSDVGFDLTIIEKYKEYGTCILFDTGIKIQVPVGYYAEIVPRSSLSKTGWMLANSVGVIDCGYTGNIYVPLIKVDPAAADLELPFKAVQLIIRKQFYSYLIDQSETTEIQETSREEGGFGSSG